MPCLGAPGLKGNTGVGGGGSEASKAPREGGEIRKFPGGVGPSPGAG